MSSDAAAHRIVVDTNAYAGNFERELCAYATGQLDETRRGERVLTSDQQPPVHSDWWAEHVVQEATAHDTLSPVEIAITPGWINNGHGGCYLDLPENHEPARAAAKEAAKAFHAPAIEKARRQLASGVYEQNWDEAGCRRTIEAAENSIATAGDRFYPAYLSVAIAVDETPPKDVLEEFRDRVETFFAEIWPRHSFADAAVRVSGYRLIDAGSEETHHISFDDPEQPSP